MVEHHRRLLRHDAGPHRGHCRGDEGPQAAADSGTHAHLAAERTRAVHRAAGNPVHQRRRADQRHGVAQIRSAHPRQPIRRGAGRGAPAGRGRGADYRHQHGRGHARRGGGHDQIPPAGGQRAGYFEGADHDRLLEVRGDRSRVALRAGQVRGEFHFAQGRRGEVQGAGSQGDELRRGGHRHGLRRKRAGRQSSAPSGNLLTGLPYPRGRGRFPGGGHHFRPERPHRGDRHRGAQQLRGSISSRPRAGSKKTCPMRGSAAG